MHQGPILPWKGLSLIDHFNNFGIHQVVFTICARASVNLSSRRIDVTMKQHGKELVAVSIVSTMLAGGSEESSSSKARGAELTGKVFSTTTSPGEMSLSCFALLLTSAVLLPRRDWLSKKEAELKKQLKELGLIISALGLRFCECRRRAAASCPDAAVSFPSDKDSVQPPESTLPTISSLELLSRMAAPHQNRK